MRNISENAADDHKTHFTVNKHIFLENRALYEIMWGGKIAFLRLHCNN
jgi:hypothetical protein